MSEQRPLPREALVTRLAVRERDVLRLDQEALRLMAESERHDPVLQCWIPAETQRFATDMDPGDELWTWSSPEWTWQDMMGRAGYAIVRNGEPIRYWMSIMN
jgi:hypothetical protein